MILGSHRFCCIDDMGFSTRHQRHYTGWNSKQRINQSNLINQNIFSAKDVSTGQKQHVSKIDEIIWPNQHQVPAVFIFDFISNISGEAKQTRRKLFPAMRSKQDANHFRQSEASKMQIISGEAKQARRTCFPAKRRKRDASYFRRSKASETQIISGEAKQARRKLFQLISSSWRLSTANWFPSSSDQRLGTSAISTVPWRVLSASLRETPFVFLVIPGWE